ncbi:MBOAT family O-acyltransferase [Desulfomarina sp.]
MVFSSVTFLFFFLPATLLAYFFSGKLKNITLLLSSLFFYAWGENIYVLVMISSIVFNFYCGIAISVRTSEKRSKPGTVLTVGIIFNLSVLFFFKYSNFIVDSINHFTSIFQFSPLYLSPVHLPIGISFFTFQALSYIVDVYKGHVPAQKNIINLGLYISLFPQLIAGPIVRYHNIASELVHRSVSRDDFSEGVRRFLYGLSKKVLLANPLALTADKIFALSVTDISSPLAWLGAVCYTFQIYFDFSGYSDMAIGLGRMFGFHFLENFNYPYISRSIREFWKRWHISLSTWFRDYLYIPLGGNRYSKTRTICNLFLVFILCGLWHGAAWTFLAWGVYHGFFLILERTLCGNFLNKIWLPIRHIITLIIIIIGWVLFRSDTINDAISYITIMFFPFSETRGNHLSLYMDSKLIFELFMATLCSFPFYQKFNLLRTCTKTDSATIQLQSILSIGELIFLFTLTYFTIISLAAGVYNPFIYFRF